MKSTLTGGRRPRSPNGTRRPDDRITIRGTSEATQVRISSYAVKLGITQGEFVDRAVAAYCHTLQAKSGTPIPENADWLFKRRSGVTTDSSNKDHEK